MIATPALFGRAARWLATRLGSSRFGEARGRTGPIARRSGIRADGASHVAIFKVRDFEALRAELGFEAAGAVMQEFAHRLSIVLPSGQVWRIGRTTLEIAFSQDVSEPLHDQLTRARDMLQQPIVIDGIEVALGITCGAAPLSPDRAVSESIDRASGALAQAAANRSFVAISDGQGRQADAIGDFALARALKAALDAGELHLHYQPKLHCRTDTVHSVEALLRWTHADLGAMRIDRVIAAAERTGIIRSLTDWVVTRAAADARSLAEAGHPVTIFVNLSGRLVADRGYIAALIAQVAASGNRLGMEITETAVIDDPADAIANVTAMAAAGIKVAIDEYGSGLSSLAYLKQLPAHELKIDQLFIRDLIVSHRDPLLVRSSIDLAHALDMEVTAEGVDDPMILSLLRIMGCDIVQGYLIARPLPLAELIAFLADGEKLQGFGRAPHSLPIWEATATEAVLP